LKQYNEKDYEDDSIVNISTFNFENKENPFIKKKFITKMVKIP
jgi:hypothetical protein